MLYLTSKVFCVLFLLPEDGEVSGDMSTEDMSVVARLSRCCTVSEKGSKSVEGFF